MGEEASATSPLRIAHLTVYRDLPAGIRKQIRSEHDAARRLHGAEWTSLAVHCGDPKEPFERRIPRFFRPLLMRSLYGWFTALRLSRNYDAVLMRHMPFDPFAFFFAPLISNRISVHHSKEIEELPLIRPGLTGTLAATMERFSGRTGVRHAKGILGVTGEIARYELETHGANKPSSVYPNGIDLETVPLADDHRSSTSIQVVFICNTFSEWHGLDRLIDAVKQAPSIPDGLIIHLIGELSETQKRNIATLGTRVDAFHIHGFLKPEVYHALLAETDVGLGSLAMDRQNLQEGTTLKVREMLAMGLPVYSGHRDAALPDDFPYYINRPKIDIASLSGFARQMKAHSRTDIRKAAASHIEKSAAMAKVITWLKTLFPHPREKR